MRKSLEETLFHWLSVLLFIVGALLLLSFQPAWALTEPAATKVSQETAYGSLPLLFIPNQGQFDNQVAYAVQGRDKSIYFTAQGLTFVLSESPAPAATRPKARDLRQTGPPAPEAKPPQQRWVIKVDFVDANPRVRPESLEQAGTLISYFKGQPEEWLTGLKASRRIIYRDLWPGIDLIYSGTVNRLKYDFIVHPGADPARIKLAWRGADSVQVTPEGRLAITTPLGTLQDEMPVAWQEGDGPRESVTVAYHLQEPKEVAAARVSRGLLAGSRPREHAQVVGFTVGDYDRTRPLVLDPEMLIYCGFIGGSGSEWGGGIAVDSNGNAYVTGSTGGIDGSFPLTVGPDLSSNGSGGAFVAKVRADGTGLVYCGFIGGDTIGRDIAVDSSGNAYVTGHTVDYYGSFPATVGPDLSYNGEFDAFVAKIKADGTGLVYCGFIGGDYNDSGEGIAVDSSGNAYVTGHTDSTDGSFPVTVGPDLSFNGYTDAFVAKVKADGTGFAYCGFIGGAGGDSGLGVAVDSSGNAYVTGTTYSTEESFPVTVGPDLSFNGYNNEYNKDAFVAKVKADGTGLAYCGFIGGARDDSGLGIEVDNNGNAYVTGETHSTEESFPATVGPDLSFNGNNENGYNDEDAFVAKVKADGTGLVYCGFIGGDTNDWGQGIAVDINGNAYVSGITCSTEESFPATVGPDLSYNGNCDAFVAKVQADGTGLVSCGFIGGAGEEYEPRIAVDNKGNAFVTGTTESTDGSFPATVGPDLSHNGGYGDVFVAKITMGQDFFPSGYFGRIRQTPLHGDPGTTFTQSGAGFTPNSTVTLRFRNQLGEELTPIQVATDAQGGFSIDYTAPQDKPFGTHTWWAVDDTTGRQSATIGYQITGPIGAQTNLPVGAPPAIIPVAQGDEVFGTLLRPSPFDPGKESFVIVHGWNREDTTLLPGWVSQMGSAIHSDPKSQAPGANVFYWNWQDKARDKKTSMPQFDSGSEPVDYLQAALKVPFDNVKDSGKMLANALQLAIPAGYDKKIHLIGHSLGTGVITYATKRALSDKYNYHYKNNIEHLTFLDSPWLFDRPADSFLKTLENQMFFDNYWSIVGKATGYWESDTNVYFQIILPDPHGYSHEWYRSSVTNFSDKTILGDGSTPSQTLPYGFYWWDDSKRTDVSSAYVQMGLHHYSLQAVPIEELAGAIVDAAVYSGEMVAETWQKLADTADRAKKKITVIAVNTYNSATDIAGYLVGELNHAVQQTGPCVDFACGWLFLQHHSDAIVSTTITIPPEANALSFGYEFKYADQGGMLELIIEDLSVFHAFSHEEIGNGYQMAPWIDVSKLSGQQVRLTFRLSNPTQDSEGGCIIDDLIFAKIEEIDTDQDALPNITENIAQCLVSNDADTDDDGIKDGDEDKNYNGIVDTGETNPCNADTDGDGIQDGTELGVTQPVPDPDGAAGPLLGTDTAKFQPDLDPATKTDPLNADTDGDALIDGEEDKNHNGRVDAGETDPAEKTAKDAAPMFFPIQDKNGQTTIIYIE